MAIRQAGGRQYRLQLTVLVTCCFPLQHSPDSAKNPLKLLICVGKKKTSAVNLSAENEARVRQALAVRGLNRQLSMLETGVRFVVI